MLRRELRNGILILRLDIPEKLNAWSAALRGEIAETLNASATDPAVKAVVITGTGERAFCAGADLSDPTMGDPDASKDRMVAYHAFYLSVLSFPKPLVAALNGMALGSALQVILLMDARIGHDQVRLSMPEINSGMPCITGATILLDVLGPILARDLCISGRFVESAEAARLGLIDALVPREEVLDRAIETARFLAGKTPEAFAETKLWLCEQFRPSLDGAFARAAEVRGKEHIARHVRFGIRDFFDHPKPAN